MSLDLALGLLLALLLGLGVWGVRSALRVSGRSARAPLTAPQLSSLAQPYRGIVGEMFEVWRAVVEAAAPAPPSVKPELDELSARVGRVVERALPRGRYGTRLLAYRDRLPASDPQHLATSASAQEVADDLRGYLATLRSLQGKVYQVLADAHALLPDDRLQTDLEDALIDVESLEEAFKEVLDEKI